MTIWHGIAIAKMYRIFFIVGVCVLALTASKGCDQVDPIQGYTSQSLHRSDVRTVFVQMFENETFRRNIEYDLTHALAAQIELSTPFKVVSDRRRADTILYGSITGVSEGVLAEQRELDRPIANQIVLVSEVSWKDLRSGEFILDGRKVKTIGQYYPLLGGGRESATRQAANEMAVRIVELMEKPW